MQIGKQVMLLKTLARGVKSQNLSPDADTVPACCYDNNGNIQEGLVGVL